MPTRPPSRIWYSRNPVPTPLGLAVRRGWLSDELAHDGVVLSALEDALEPQVRHARLDHGVAGAIRQGGSLSALWARATGARTRLIGLTWTDEFQAVLVRPDSPVTTASDLAGRRIGIPRRHGHGPDLGRAIALRGIANALRGVGLDLEAVQLTDLTVSGTDLAQSRPRGQPSDPYAAQEWALSHGIVDAIVVKGPDGIAAMRRLGARIVVDIGAHPDPLLRINNGTPRLITVDDWLAREHPTLLRHLMGRVVEAGLWATTHAAAVEAYACDVTGQPADVVRPAYDGALHRRLTVDLDPGHLAAVANHAAFLHRHGLLPAAVDVGAWIDGSFIGQADAAAA